MILTQEIFYQSNSSGVEMEVRAFNTTLPWSKKKKRPNAFPLPFFVSWIWSSRMSVWKFLIGPFGLTAVFWESRKAKNQKSWSSFQGQTLLFIFVPKARQIFDTPFFSRKCSTKNKARGIPWTPKPPSRFHARYDFFGVTHTPHPSKPLFWTPE